ncbi:hypothetical protein GCM10017083_26540 [Thalassobaculum fulvum]|uniref:Transmembrane protein (PGPGW) n=2 Tax=Thalassobaculum fulvum TaxID=1633335 RepID=A0A918XSK5_9PROT|nr:hypothetical protein GCM10017083_26540 [Thalassobaculum fulvum]
MLAAVKDLAMKIAGRRPMTVIRDGVRWADDTLPPGVRTAAGFLLMIGGLFGFLPVLGFWMLPLGGAVAALDIPFLRRRLLGWLDRVGAEPDRATPGGASTPRPGRPT